MHTKGPWRIGKHGGCVVADHPIDGGVRGTSDVEHYGGHLVAETVAACNAPALAAAPELLARLERMAQVASNYRNAPTDGNARRLDDEVQRSMSLLERVL